MNGAAADLANKSPDGTALFNIASHRSGFRAAEGRPDVMVFAWASAQVAVIAWAEVSMADAPLGLRAINSGDLASSRVALYAIHVFGTFPPLAASWRMTSLWSQTFIFDEPFVFPE